MYKPYFHSLNSFLALLDQHYVEGRFLWLNHAFNGAGNLLWMSFEQMIKLLIVQAQIEKNLIGEVKLIGQKEKLRFDTNESNLKLRAQILDSLFRKIESNHKLDSLLNKLKETTEIDVLSKYTSLAKVNEFFHRRYVVHAGTSIDPAMLNEIDEIFFYLRSFVSIEIPQSFIDEIIFRKRYHIQEPIPFFATLFHKNNFIAPRKYNDVLDKIPDGRVIAHNGIQFRDFPKEEYDSLVRKGYLIQLRWTYLKMKN